MHSDHSDRMPNWPARMNLSMAALYLGIGHNTLHEGSKSGRFPAPVREGGRIFWAKRQLDEFVAAQFGLAEPSERKNTCADI